MKQAFTLGNRRLNRMACDLIGVSLVELLAVIALLAILGAIGVPAYQRVMQNAYAAGCVSNLRQLGAGLNTYLVDHDMTMPILQAGRHDKSEDVPVLDNTLDSYLK